jgi:murein DD-endopeptidase MepM/ murein hydrolase activator NlpD
LTRAGARTIAYAVVASLAALTAAAAPPGGRTGPSVAHLSVNPQIDESGAGSTSLREVPELAPLEVDAPTGTDTVVVAGRIASNLYAALDSSAATMPVHARWKLAWSMADIFEYRIDMSRDLRVGDAFRVLVERVMDPAEGVKLGRVLATTFVLSRDTLTAVRFAVADGSATSHAEASAGDYFDVHGRSLRAAFLRAPVEFRRISSGFGMRLHPILRIWRAHKGTDYVAAAGTPVRAIGDGVVVFAGQKGGYGNVIDLRHRNGYVTRYGHLSRFAAGIRQGARVTIGKTIAYVGMTGLATAPHLHFEVLVNGVQRDPRVALHDRGSGDPVPANRRDAFDRTAHQLLGALDATGSAAPRTVASRN